MADARSVSGGGHWVDGGATSSGDEWVATRLGVSDGSGIGEWRAWNPNDGVGCGPVVQLGRTRPGWDGAKSGSGAPDVQNEVFSLQNRVQLGCGAHWQYFQKPECLTAKDGKRSVRQQRRVIWHVQ